MRVALVREWVCHLCGWGVCCQLLFAFNCLNGCTLLLILFTSRSTSTRPIFIERNTNFGSLGINSSHVGENNYSYEKLRERERLHVLDALCYKWDDQL